jgi:DNA polymerase III sliding clamp (beta) subunit (PCNA family)
MHTVTVMNGELKAALKSIAPSLSKSDPHVDLVFAEHRLTLHAIVATSPYNGAPTEIRGTVEMSCTGNVTGTIGINPKFLLDTSSAFSDDVELRLYLPDGKECDPALIETD